jgi:hypothetical protein
MTGVRSGSERSISDIGKTNRPQLASPWWCWGRFFWHPPKDACQIKIGHCDLSGDSASFRGMEEYFSSKQLIVLIVLIVVAAALIALAMTGTYYGLNYLMLPR